MFTAIFLLIFFGVIFAALGSLSYDVYQIMEYKEAAKKAPRQIPPDDLIGELERV